MNFSNWTRRHWILFLIALLIVAIILVLSAPERLQQDLPEEDRAEQPQPTAENVREWLDLKQRGIGFLENQECTESSPIFERLATELPSETLGLRNLTVSRLVGLSKINSALDPAAFAAASQDAESAALALLKAEPESAEAWILAARIARAGDHTELALERYRQAVELAPDNPGNRFELAELLRSSNRPEARQEAAEHLQRAFAADSENLFLFVELAGLQAETENPGLAETLQAGCPLLTPLAESIRQFARVDIAELCEQAQAGVSHGEWNGVLRNVRILANVLRPEDATQSDRRRVDRDPLEFVQFDFSPAFDAAASAFLPSVPAAIPITFNMQSITTARDWLQPGETLTRCQLIDFDLDGTLDLAVLTSGRLLILRQEAVETEWSLSSEIKIPTGAVGLLAADLDNDPSQPTSSQSERARDASRDATVNSSSSTTPVFRPEQDADLDFVVYGSFGVRIYANELTAESGQRSLVAVDPQKITSVESSTVSEPAGTVTAATIVDLDHDGDLDIVLCGPSIQVLTNRGNLQFQVRSVPTGTPASFSSIRDIAVVDWDRDVDLDLLLLTDRGIGLIENLRHGRLRYRDIEVENLPATNLHRLSVADIDSNGSWDLFVGCSDGVALIRTDIPTVGVVQFRAAELISSEPASGLRLCDVDNDGWQDVVSWNDELLQVLRSLNGEEFTPFLEQSLATAASIRDCDCGDIDRDGDLDLAIATATQVEQLVNKGGNANGWIDVAIRGQQVKGEQRSASGRVNHYGIGSLLELKAGPHYQQLRVDRQVMHFGLGDQSRANLLRILWTNGIPHNILQPHARELIYEKQTLKGSCPYLYTWNGEFFEFCTDLLWAAPIGLQFANGQIAPTRPWEYLKIPGPFLQETDGE